jgi:uncharacterized protein
MARLLVAVVLVVLAVYLLRRALRGGAPQARAGEKPAAPPSASQGELVRCAQCGVHLPRAEARMTAERFYCSEEHARLGAGKS